MRRATWFLWAAPLAGLCLAGGALALSGDAPPPQPRSRGEHFDPLSQPGTYEKLPTEKKAEVDQQNARLAEAAKTPYDQLKQQGSTMAVPSSATPRLALPHSVAGEGMIVGGGCGVEDRKEFREWNSWWWTVGDDTVRVCAGQLTAERSQGMVLVNHTDSGRVKRLEPLQWFPAPGKTGLLSIVSADGHVLTLHGEDGSVLYFDVAKRAFVGGPPGETATPVPGAAVP